MPSTNTLRWDLKLRYRLIEIVALWEGRLTTRHLCTSFGIGRQQASKDINHYNREIAPDNLRYDSQRRGYVPAPGFRPVLTQGSADEYLHILSHQQDTSHAIEGLNLELAKTEILQLPPRQLPPERLRLIVKAVREQQRLEIGYLSLSSPEEEDRIISPHTLVYTGLRWHVRAFCEKNRDFRDFVLTRFRGTPELLGEALQKPNADQAWHIHVAVKIAPDPRLSLAQQDIVAKDYGMSNGMMVIKTRGALVKYTLQMLNIDPQRLEESPQAQQLTLANLEELQAWLF